MEEMHSHLSRKKSALKSKWLLLLVGFGCQLLSAQQTACLHLSLSGYPGDHIYIQHSSGFQAVSFETSIHLEKDQSAFYRLPTRLTAAYVNVLSDDRKVTHEVYLSANDTITLGWDATGSHFTLRNDPFNRNAKIAALNALIDQRLEQFTRSRRILADKRKLVALSDSIRQAAQHDSDVYLRSWTHFICADLDLSSGILNRNELVKRSFFGFQPEPENPAWQRAFSALLDGDMLTRLNGKNGPRYSSAIVHHQPDSLRLLYFSDTTLPDTIFASWAMLKGIYDLEQMRNYRLEDAYKTLLPLRHESENPDAIGQEINKILMFWEPRIKGRKFPEFDFTSLNQKAAVRLDAMQGKPVYVALLPDFSPNSQLVLRQIQGLQQKYGKEIRFVVIADGIPETQYAGVSATFPELVIGTMESCRSRLQYIFPSLDRIQFFLLDGSGQVFQNPAEGPDTGIESAFLTVINSR